MILHHGNPNLTQHNPRVLVKISWNLHDFFTLWPNYHMIFPTWNFWNKGISPEISVIWLDDIIVGILTTSTPRKTKTIPWAEIIASLKHWGTMVVNNALFATLKLWFVGASFPVVGEWGWISTNDIGHLRNDTRWLRYTILGEQSLTLPEVNILLMEKKSCIGW